MQAFTPDEVLGMQEEVQLREQDFGNFQVRLAVCGAALWVVAKGVGLLCRLP